MKQHKFILSTRQRNDRISYRKHWRQKPRFSTIIESSMIVVENQKSFEKLK